MQLIIQEMHVMQVKPKANFAIVFSFQGSRGGEGRER
jgi:hypothetical protein